MSLFFSNGICDFTFLLSLIINHKPNHLIEIKHLVYVTNNVRVKHSQLVLQLLLSSACVCGDFMGVCMCIYVCVVS